MALLCHTKTSQLDDRLCAPLQPRKLVILTMTRYQMLHARQARRVGRKRASLHEFDPSRSLAFCAPNEAVIGFPVRAKIIFKRLIRRHLGQRSE